MQVSHGRLSRIKRPPAQTVRKLCSVCTVATPSAWAPAWIAGESSGKKLCACRMSGRVSRIASRTSRTPDAECAVPSAARSFAGQPPMPSFSTMRAITSIPARRRASISSSTATSSPPRTWYRL